MHLSVVSQQPHWSFAAALAAVGTYHLVWAVAALWATRRVPLPRTTLALAVTLTVLWAVSGIAGLRPWGGAGAPSATSLLAVVSFEAACAAAVAVTLVVWRRTPQLGPIPLAALIAGAVAMSAVVTPGVAAAQAAGGHVVVAHHH